QPEMAAPVVVAKGCNLIAQQIKQVALWHGIPLVENPPLAQVLYRAVEIGQSIPPKLFAVVAEILAAIYRAQSRAAAAVANPGGRSWPMAEIVKPAAGEKGSAVEWIIPAAAVSMVFVMLVPLPALLLDLLLAISITAAVRVLLSALHILRPAQFSVF